MGKYIITGTERISGSVNVQGSKNSAVAVLLSSVVTDGVSVIRNLPDITDVADCLEILGILGAKITRPDKTTAVIDTKNLEYKEIPARLLDSMRASSYLIGGMLARFGKCPRIRSGGCDFGGRPLDYHFYVMEKLGAEINDGLTAKKGLSGAEINFAKRSVGATVNALIAASLAKGTTVIRNAATEPHVTDTAKFLLKSGAQIEGTGTDILTVRGVPSLSGAEHFLCPDMIEAGTFLMLGAMPGNSVTVNRVDNSQLSALYYLFDRMNINYSVSEKHTTVIGGSALPAELRTSPYPGFPTDLQPLCAVLFGLTHGKSRIVENVFGTRRFRYAEMLKRMGLDCSVRENVMEINGLLRYKAAKVECTDLRGGAAIVLAASVANGTSEVGNVKYIERGYSDFAAKLRSLGVTVFEEK